MREVEHKEFGEYKAAKKTLNVFRLKAVRPGFKKAWQKRGFTLILAVTDKVPNNVLEEDQKLSYMIRPGSNTDGREIDR